MIELGLPGDHAEIEGVTVFVSRNLRPGDITRNGRLPTTSVARTLLDLATRYDRRALLRALAEAEFQHDLRPADVEGTLRRGHPGSANLRAALHGHAPGDSDDDRDLWLRRHGYVARRYGKRQLDERPDDVIADLLEALG